MADERPALRQELQAAGRADGIVSYRDLARAQLKVDEGVRLKPYRDSVGILSVGVGRNLEDRGLR